jgi:hypothetical protein
VSIVNSQIFSNTARYVRAHAQEFPSPPWETHMCLLFAGWRCPCIFRHGHDNVFLDLREYRLLCACSCSKFPIAPMGDSRFARCLQGGGVAVYGGTVSIVNSQIFSNIAVRAHVQKFPDGKVADVLAPTHACTTANAPVNYSMSVLQRP